MVMLRSDLYKIANEIDWKYIFDRADDVGVGNMNRDCEKYGLTCHASEPFASLNGWERDIIVTHGLTNEPLLYCHRSTYETYSDEALAYLYVRGDGFYAGVLKFGRYKWYRVLMKPFVSPDRVLNEVAMFDDGRTVVNDEYSSMYLRKMYASGRDIKVIPESEVSLFDKLFCYYKPNCVTHDKYNQQKGLATKGTSVCVDSEIELYKLMVSEAGGVAVSGGDLVDFVESNYNEEQNARLHRIPQRCGVVGVYNRSICAGSEQKYSERLEQFYEIPIRWTMQGVVRVKGSSYIDAVKRFENAVKNDLSEEDENAVCAEGRQVRYSIRVLEKKLE